MGIVTTHTVYVPCRCGMGVAYHITLHTTKKSQWHIVTVTGSPAVIRSQAVLGHFRVIPVAVAMGRIGVSTPWYNFHKCEPIEKRAQK